MFYQYQNITGSQALIQGFVLNIFILQVYRVYSDINLTILNWKLNNKTHSDELYFLEFVYLSLQFI